MIPDGSIATVGKRAGAPVADSRRVVGIAAEYPCRDPAQPNPRGRRQMRFHIGNSHTRNRDESREEKQGHLLGHEAAVVVADAVPYHVVAHFGPRRPGRFLPCLITAPPLGSSARAGLPAASDRLARPERGSATGSPRRRQGRGSRDGNRGGGV